jgi:hypothetical protein
MYPIKIIRVQVIETINSSQGVHTMSTRIDEVPREIRLRKSTTGWTAQFSDPAVLRLFGTDTLPLPYTAKAPAETVIANVREGHPTAAIEVVS